MISSVTITGDVKPKRYGLGVRHIQLILLFLCMVSTYVTRVNLSMAIVGMTEKIDCKSIESTDINPTFDWDEDIKGTVLSSFFWGYLVMNVPAAVITHKFNNKLLLAVVMSLNSLLCFLTPFLTTNFGDVCLIIIRILQGLLQGFMMPTMHNLLSKWVPPTERARAGAFVIGGMNLGISATMFTSGYLMCSKIGWPLIYYASGCVTIIWIILWSILAANSPDAHKRISEEEKNYIKSTLIHTANENNRLSIPWKSILTSKPVWAIVFAHMGQNWGMWTMLTEIPTFFNSALGIDVKSDGQLSSLPYFLMWIASFPLSFLADFFIKRNVMTIGTSRKFWNNIGQTLSGLFLISLPYIAQYLSHNVTIIVYTIATVLNSCMLFGFNINHIDIAPNFSCILMGISNGAANITSILGPLFVGFVVENEESISDWRPVFFMSAGCYIIGSVIFTVFGSGSVQPWNSQEQNVQETEKNDLH